MSNVKIGSNDEYRLKIVIEFAENVLREGRDCYRSEPSPLLADGINVRTKEHLTWRFPGGREVVISNLANQQNLLRVFVGLTNITGDSKYKKAAESIISYYFQNMQNECGLLHWGGHRFIDLKTLSIVGTQEKQGIPHELKNSFPFYDLMYQVDSMATIKYIRALWNAHLLNWDTLQINRHGYYGLKSSKLWANPFHERPPFFEAVGLSFLNTGNDLMYAAGLLYKLAGEKGALLWLKRLARQYFKARDPKTRLGAYQFNQAKKLAWIDDDQNTLSQYGDRAERQFGPEFGSVALEGKVLFQRQAESIYYHNAIIQLQLGLELGAIIKEFMEWTREGLNAFSKYAYVPETNMFRPLFTDGTDLSGYVLKRDGYYGKKGDIVNGFPASNKFLLAYVRGFLQTGDQKLWDTARKIAKSNGLGDIGADLGSQVSVNLSTSSDDLRALYSMVEMYQQCKHPYYLELARKIGNNIVANRFHYGYFVPGECFKYANFDAKEPLALLALQAATDGKPEVIPTFVDGGGFVHGNYEFPDGVVRTYHTSEFYKEIRI